MADHSADNSQIAQALEHAIDGRLQVGVYQPGWLIDLVYVDTGFDSPAQLDARDYFAGEDGPFTLELGLVALPPDAVDRLRAGTAYVCRVFDVTSGLLVRLTQWRLITWEMLRFSAEPDEPDGPDAAPVPPLGEPRWGTVEEAARLAGVSRATLDRMRRLQRERGWELPGDPVPVGVGTRRRRENWDLDRVPEWAAAFARRRETEKPAGSTRAPRRRAGRRPAHRVADPPGAGETQSLYARAVAVTRRKPE